MAKEYDFLIVGSGLFGATLAYEATKKNKKCLVIEKRSHLGGNIYCEKLEGINVHKYGAHIFHTSNKIIWDYVSRLVDFNRYTNSPIALASDGCVYNLPFNMNTFYQMWHSITPEEALRELEKQRESARKEYGIIPKNLEQQALILIGSDIYKKLIKGYTEKQWGRPCSELPPEIIKRLPVRLSFDNNYFNDNFQGIPTEGYNALIDKMLLKCDIKLECDYLDNTDYFDSLAERIVYTGPLDRFFNFNCGQLEYRTVTFDTEIIKMPNFQGNAVVNYTSAEIPFTRIIEHKHFEFFGDSIYDNPLTVISREYPMEWYPGIEPYYPINDYKNNKIYNKYKEQIKCLPTLPNGNPKYIFGGRLADYKYYDMAPTIEKALELFEAISV